MSLLSDIAGVLILIGGGLIASIFPPLCHLFHWRIDMLDRFAGGIACLLFAFLLLGVTIAIKVGMILLPIIIGILLWRKLH